LRSWSNPEPEEFVFPMPSKPGRYMSENTLNNALRILDYDTRKDHCHHGFRTTFSTNMNEQGWNRDWIEAQLAHVDKNGVRSAYNKAVYLEGRREMMQHYADWLDEVAKVPWV
jgi:integrase